MAPVMVAIALARAPASPAPLTAFAIAESPIAIAPIAVTTLVQQSPVVSERRLFRIAWSVSQIRLFWPTSVSPRSDSSSPVLVRDHVTSIGSGGGGGGGCGGVGNR